MVKHDIVIAGYLCIDFIPDLSKVKWEHGIADFIKPGKIIEIDGIDIIPGGLVANTGLVMDLFGKKVYLNALRGADAIGQLLQTFFTHVSSESGLKLTEEGKTAFSIVIGPSDTDRFFLESIGCNAQFDLSHMDKAEIRQSRMLHFGYPPLLKKFYQNDGANLTALFKETKAAGVITSLDFSLPDLTSESGKTDWTSVMKNVLPHTDIFTPSLEELIFIMDPKAYQQYTNLAGDDSILEIVPAAYIQELGRKVLAAGVKILFIKMGHRGSYLITSELGDLAVAAGRLSLDLAAWNRKEYWCKALAADPDRIKNASGAGDTSIAAFLTAVLNNETPENALLLAAIAGRNNLYCNNLVKELPGWSAMQQECRELSAKEQAGRITNNSRSLIN